MVVNTNMCRIYTGIFWVINFVKQEVFFNLTIVRAQAGEPVEVLIRKFNKKVLSDGILNELKKREFYEKPSVVRKREKKERARVAYNRRSRGE